MLGQTGYIVSIGDRQRVNEIFKGLRKCIIFATFLISRHWNNSVRYLRWLSTADWAICSESVGQEQKINLALCTNSSRPPISISHIFMGWHFIRCMLCTCINVIYLMFLMTRKLYTLPVNWRIGNNGCRLPPSKRGAKIGYMFVLSCDQVITVLLYSYHIHRHCSYIQPTSLVIKFVKPWIPNHNHRSASLFMLRLVISWPSLLNTK